MGRRSRGNCWKEILLLVGIGLAACSLLIGQCEGSLTVQKRSTLGESGHPSIFNLNLEEDEEQEKSLSYSRRRRDVSTPVADVESKIKTNVVSF